MPDAAAAATEQPILFLSFDLANSTQFKVGEPTWPGVLQAFYVYARREMKDAVPDISLWKYVGDEVLFFIRPTGVTQVGDVLRAALRVQKSVMDQLYSAFPVARAVLALKGTAWLAMCGSEGVAATGGSDFRTKNLAMEVADLGVGTPGRVDFVGPDVDIGFRIAKYAQHNFMVLSAPLAHFLSLYGGSDWEERTRVVSYEALKGVWGDRRYPIIWTSHSSTAWQDLRGALDYDAPFRFPWLAAPVSREPDPLERIGEVMRQLDRESEAAEFRAAISRPAANLLLQSEPLNAEKLAEVHCVAICVDESRVLLAKRREGKATLPGRWEFGCAQLRPNQDFKTCLREHYAADFGVQLTSIWPDPVRTYVLEKPGRTIPGLIFAATVLDSETASSNEDKHSELRWLSRDEIEALDDDACVPDLKDSAIAALDVVAGKPPSRRPPEPPPS